MYHVTNYEALVLLIGCKPKLPAECTQFEDVLQNLDFTAEEVEMLSQCITEDNFQNLVKMRDSVFKTAEAKIKKGQKRQKKEKRGLRNTRPFKIKVGDIVLKERQKDILRKGGKLHDRYNMSTYTVTNIMANGKCCFTVKQVKGNIINTMSIEASQEICKEK